MKRAMTSKHPKVGGLIDVRARRCIGSADDRRLAVLMRQRDQPERIEPLIEHAAAHDHVGPGKIFVPDVFAVAIDEAHIPVRRQHGGDGDQSERSCRTLRADQLAGFRIIPEIIRLKARLDHEHVAIGQPAPAGNLFNPLLHGTQIRVAFRQLISSIAALPA
jgi:hypothetical protein